MKRIVSLIMTASILLQTVIPVASMVTYAEIGDLYGLKWEQSKSLSRELVENNIKTGAGEALVSWKTGDVAGSYTLEYFAEDVAKADGSAEKVQLIFNRSDLGNLATVEVKVFDKDNKLIDDKGYKRFNFDSTGSDDWIDMVTPGEKIITIQKGSKIGRAHV